MDSYIDVPKGLTRSMLEEEFGSPAVAFYMKRIEERRKEGKIYYTDCDSCTEFRRIPPQYCARCGITFYERAENRFCTNCRVARLKQAQRHWCRVNNL